MLDYNKISSTFSGDNIFIIPIDGEEMEKENSQNEKVSNTNVNDDTGFNYTSQNYINYNKRINNNMYSNSNFNNLTNDNININFLDKSKNNPYAFDQLMHQNQVNGSYKYENNDIINNNIIYEDNAKNNNVLSFLNLKTNFKKSNSAIYNYFTSEYLENNWKNNIRFQLYKLKTELTQKVLFKMSYDANYGNINLTKI